MAAQPSQPAGRPPERSISGGGGGGQVSARVKPEQLSPRRLLKLAKSPAD